MPDLRHQVPPHEYRPDQNPQFMGDCAVCGHVQGSLIHQVPPQDEAYPLKAQVPPKEERRDRRTLPGNLTPPNGRTKRSVSSYLKADDYRRFYELCMERNVSGNELIRQLIREAKP